MTADLTFDPDWVVHPGEVLEEVMGDHGLTVRTLADAIQVSTETIQAILDGRAPITEEIACRLQALCLVPDRLWLNLQRQHDAGVARLEARARLRASLERST